MPEENLNQEFKLKKIDEMRSCLIEEINQTKLMSKKHKKLWRFLNYIDHCNVYNYWIWFHFCFCFFSCYSYRNYKFCNWIKNFWSNCRN